MAFCYRMDTYFGVIIMFILYTSGFYAAYLSLQSER
jgi:hypothetical protein